jgi:hypothetical protein
MGDNLSNLLGNLSSQVACIERTLSFDVADEQRKVAKVAQQNMASLTPR